LEVKRSWEVSTDGSLSPWTPASPLDSSLYIHLLSQPPLPHSFLSVDFFVHT
jgi:hypothetical protein